MKNLDFMRTPKQTNVILTEPAQKVKDRFAPIYSLKNILSAGLLLFADLPRGQREEAIARANGLDAETIVTATQEKTQAKKRSPGQKKPKSA